MIYLEIGLDFLKTMFFHRSIDRPSGFYSALRPIDCSTYPLGFDSWYFFHSAIQYLTIDCSLYRRSTTPFYPPFELLDSIDSISPNEKW